MNNKFSVDVLKNMKPQDKAKAFDMIVDVCNRKDLPDEDVVDILNWCSGWFGD